MLDYLFTINVMKSMRFFGEVERKEKKTWAC